MPWKDNVPPLPVTNLTLRRLSHYVTLNWQSGPPAADGDAATYYVLYRFEPTEASTPNDPRRILALPASNSPERHRSDYLTCISPAWNRSRRELYAMPLPTRLPVIRIPLRESEPPAKVDRRFTSQS